MPGLKRQDFVNLDFWAKDLFANTWLKLNFEPILMEKAVSFLDDLRFDTACDRSVQGSMRTIRLQDLEGILWNAPDVMQLPMYPVSARLCHRPVTTNGMKESECIWPDKEMEKLIQSL